MLKKLYKTITECFKFVKLWVISRKVSSLLISLPILLLTSFLVFIVVSYAPSSTKILAQRYIQAAQKAFTNKQFDEAELLWRKASLLTSASPTVIHGLAQLAIEKKNLGRGLQLLQKHAPFNKTGDPECHFLTAQILIQQHQEETKLQVEQKASDSNQKTPNKESQLIPLIVHHLESTIKQDPKHQQANLILAEYYMKTQQLKEAEKTLLTLVDNIPQARLYLAKVYLGLKDTDNARKEANKLSIDLAASLKKSPTDKNSRLQLIQCYEILSEEEKLVEAIEKGIELFPSESNYKHLLSQFYLMKCLKLENKDDFAIKQKMEYVQESLMLSPKNPQALQLVAQLSLIDSPETAAARDELTKALAEGYATSTVHLILGTNLIQQNKLDEAQIHLELALRESPNHVAIINNLAWLLSIKKNPDLELALKLLEKPIVLMPGLAEMRDTRANIYLKLKKYKEAITDWEIALKSANNKSEIHQHLAECYGALNMSDLHELHQQKSAEFKVQDKK